jgi:glutathione S-transferase
MMTQLTLIATKTSHFARKARIVLHELGLDFELQMVHDLFNSHPTTYGGNPLMQVPTLLDGDTWFSEADQIARHLVTSRVPRDPLNVLNPKSNDCKQLVVLNGIMAHEATIVLARAGGGMSNVMDHTWSRKLARAVGSGLGWLDQQIESDRVGFDYLDVTTVCMWHHHLHFDLIPGLPAFPRLAARVARFSNRPSVLRTAP